MKENTYPIVGHIEAKDFGPVPILDIRMMSDEREKELGTLSADKWKGRKPRPLCYTFNLRSCIHKRLSKV